MIRRPTPAQSAKVKYLLRGEEKVRQLLREHEMLCKSGHEISGSAVKSFLENWEKQRAEEFKKLSEDEYAAYLLIKHELEMKSGQQLPA